MNVYDEIIESVHAEPGRGVAVRWLMSPANLQDCGLLTLGAAAERRLLREAEALTFDGVPVVVDPTRERPALIVEQAIDEIALRRRDDDEAGRVAAHHARRYEAMFLEGAARNLNHIRQALAAGEIEKALGMATELEEAVRGRQAGLVGA